MPLKTYMRFPHTVIIREPGLLPMLYTPGELEEDLGKIAEQWVAVDNLGMLQQLGVVPVAG